MKKLSIILVILSFLFANQVSACDCGPEVNKVLTTIDNASYDPDMDEIYFNSVEDAEGGFWTLTIDEEEDMELSIEALTAKYSGVTIGIYYVINLEENNIEIVTSTIHKK